jgi:hypothetical protein
MIDFLNCLSGGQISNTKNEHCEAVADSNIITEEYLKHFAGMVVSFDSTSNELCLFNGIPFAMVTNDAKVYRLGIDGEHSQSVAISKCGRRYAKTTIADVKTGDLLGINEDGYFIVVAEPSLAHAKACSPSFVDSNAEDQTIYLVDVEFDFSLPRGAIIQTLAGRKLSEGKLNRNKKNPLQNKNTQNKMQEILKENEKLKQDQ